MATKDHKVSPQEGEYVFKYEPNQKRDVTIFTRSGVTYMAWRQFGALKIVPIIIGAKDADGVNITFHLHGGSISGKLTPHQ